MDSSAESGKRSAERPVVGESGAGLFAVGRAHWRLCLYPSAAEAGGCLYSPRRGGESSWQSDPERPALEAARRARAKIRRYCAGNRLNRFATLTYAGEGCYDPVAVRADVAVFFRGLRRNLGGEAIPYVWVPEWHPGGHGLHVHFAVGRYIGYRLIRDTWGRGIVHIKLLGDLPVGSGSLEEAREAGRYLAKYASKAVDSERPAGLHRYEVAQGFQPESIYLGGGSAEHVIAQASARMGREPAHVWRSRTQDGWQGPPACWAIWND